MKKTLTQTFSVAGIHCAACEILIQKKLSPLPQILEVHVSKNDNTVSIVSKKGSRIDVDMLNRTMYDLGYTFSEHQSVTQAEKGGSSWIQAIIVLVLLAVVYLILEDTHILARITVDARSSILAFLGLGLVASFSSCAALVGGLLLALSKQWNSLYGGKNEHKRTTPFVLFNVGRLVSYAVLGGVLGAVGSIFQISFTASGLIIILVSIVMIVVALQMLGISWAHRVRLGFPRFLTAYAADEQNFKGTYMPFVAGFATFFLPCGFTLMAQSIALASGSFVTGAVMMGAFALGTLPMLSFISFTTLKMQTPAVMNVTFNRVVGILLVIFAVFNINSQLNVLGVVSLNDVFVQPAASVQERDSELGVKIVGEGSSEEQRVTMAAREFEYFPKTLKLKAGIPTTLTVTAQDVVGCAQGMWLGGLSEEVLYLNKKVSTVTFVPQPGSYKISCTMGMVVPVIVTVI